jgi:hypothetical protein
VEGRLPMNDMTILSQSRNKCMTPAGDSVLSAFAPAT